MKKLDNNGHLSGVTLRRLASGEALSEQERLAASQHLCSCDQCLLRYTELLTEETMPPLPERKKETWLWRVRVRIVQLMTSRYATAAAAMAIAVTLWAGGCFHDVVSVTREVSQAQTPAAVTEFLHGWSEKVDQFCKDIWNTVPRQQDHGEKQTTVQTMQGGFGA